MGVLWRFSKSYMADWRVGRIESPRVPLADAVAASAAFPPVLSPFTMELGDAQWASEADNQVRDLRKRQCVERVHPGRSRRRLLGNPKRDRRLPARRRAALPGRTDRGARRDPDQARAPRRPGPGAADQLGLCDLRRRAPRARGSLARRAGAFSLPGGRGGLSGAGKSMPHDLLSGDSRVRRPPLTAPPRSVRPHAGGPR